MMMMSCPAELRPREERSRNQIIPLEHQPIPIDNNTSIMSETPRRVSFKDNDEILEIPCRRDSTEIERHAMSFSSDDLKGMRKREKRLSEKLSICGGINHLEDDMTGLFSYEDNSQRSKRISDGISSVLTAQEHQCGSRGGIRDHECIAETYCREVNESKLLARNRGFNTAMQVEEESKEEENRPLSCPSIIQDPNPCKWDMNIADSDVGTMFEVARNARTMRAPFSRMIVIPIEDVLPRQ